MVFNVFGSVTWVPWFEMHRNARSRICSRECARLLFLSLSRGIHHAYFDSPMMCPPKKGWSETIDAWCAAERHREQVARPWRCHVCTRWNADEVDGEARRLRGTSRVDGVGGVLPRACCCSRDNGTPSPRPSPLDGVEAHKTAAAVAKKRTPQ